MASNTLEFEGMEIRLATRQLLIGRQPAGIGSRAFDILVALVENHDRIVSKDELLNTVWPGVFVEENTLQVHVSALRKLLGPHKIVTIPGRGYRFCAENATNPHLSDTAPSVSRSKARGNLPAWLPPIFGRERELAQLPQRVRDHRLLTLVGSAGIGKSRLARTLAWSLCGEWPDGVWFVELAPIENPCDVPFAILRTLDLPFPAKDPALEKTMEALRPSRMLLVIDNCEHVIDAVGALVNCILAHAPEIHLVLTSQIPLRLPEEQRFSVPPLTIPSPEDARMDRNSGALTLLEARVRAVTPGFRLTDLDLPAAVEICRRLDGLPLAIELAAGRIPLLGVQGVRDRLNERFRLLSDLGSNRLPRHQTLRTALEWSYSLLNEQEQAILRRLGVFHGDFSLACAKTVACDDQLDKWDVLDGLANLVDKSMLVVESGDSPRYRLLESPRILSLEKLNERGEFAGASEKHAQALLEEFERSEEEKWVLTINERLGRYRHDIDNLKAALKWAAHPTSDPEFLIALVGASVWLFRSLGYRTLAEHYCEEAIERISAPTPPAMEARILVAWVGLRFPRIGTLELDAIAKAVSLLRKLDDPSALVAALADCAACLAIQNDISLAHQTIHEAYERSARLEPRTARLKVVRADFWLHYKEGRLQEGCELLRDGVALALELGDTYAAVWGLVRWELLAYNLGDLDEAVRIGRKAVSLVRDANFHGKIRWFALGSLTFALAQSGQCDEALALGREIFDAHHNTYRLLEFLDVMALIALRRGLTIEAAQALGCANAGFALRSEARRFPEDQIPDMLRDSLSQLLPPEQLNKHLRAGALLTPKQAAHLALQIDAALSTRVSASAFQPIVSA